MSYKRPGITVTQEFVGILPALAAFNLPCVVVGPAYQLVTEDNFGSYLGLEHVYSYASLMGGAIVDLEFPDDEEVFPETKKNVAVTLKNIKLQVVEEKATGSATSSTFSDLSTDVFENVAEGDILVIKAVEGLTLVAAQTDGEVTTAQPKRLVGSTGLFTNLKAGDEVIVTGGTNITAGTYTVVAKVDNQTVLVNADINDGVGDSTNCAYSVTGDRGQDNAGSYTISTVTDENNLVLASPIPVGPEAPLTYDIQRSHANVSLTRVESLPDNGFLAEATGITLPAGLQITIGSVDYDIASASVYADYRALRIDLASEVREYSQPADLYAVFGTDQVTPANPLAYGLSIMLQNTVTAINGLGLDAQFMTDESLSFTNAAYVLSLTEMYAIALLTFSPVVHTTFKNHVNQMSAPLKKKERIVLINSRLLTTMTLKAEDTTSTALNGSRNIVSAQVDGSGAIANPDILIDLTTDTFMNVQLGDSVTIVSGTNVTPGTYAVTQKTDNNHIKVASAFITSGTPTDIVYYIQRKDGIGADGKTFYDRDANFLSDGIAAGHFMSITSGTYEGRYLIGSITNEKTLVLSEAIAGIITLASGVTYKIDRDLSKTEQANLVKGYSESFASRRVVHMWPDILELPLGQDIIDVPGYYGCCPVAALTSGLPTQQGLTNLSVSGFLGLQHSTKYFDDDQLDIIADGGTMIYIQDGEGQALYIRHQLTTDRSAIKFQEYSITKNVDYIAKFIRTSHSAFPGQWNIVDTTMDALKSTATAIIAFLKEGTIVPKLGGVIKGGSLVLLEESSTQIDTINERYSFSIPIPLNNIDITIEV
jgi:hypothetical protein